MKTRMSPIIFIPAGMVGVASILVLIAAVLITTVTANINNYREVKDNEKLEDLSNKLCYAQIFVWISLAFAIFYGIALAWAPFINWLKALFLVFGLGTLITSLVFTVLSYITIDGLPEEARDENRNYMIASIVLISVGILMLLIAGVWGFFIPYMINKVETSQPEYKYAKNVDIISPSGEASYRQVVTASPVPRVQYIQTNQPIRVPTQQSKIKYHTHKQEKSQIKVVTPSVSPIRIKPPKSRQMPLTMQTPRTTFVSVPRYQYQRNIQITKPKKKVLSPYAF